MSRDGVRLKHAMDEDIWMGVLLHHLYVDVHARWNGHHRRLYSCTSQQPQETSTHRPAIVSL
jgi:hypothetical protein